MRTFSTVCSTLLLFLGFAAGHAAAESATTPRLDASRCNASVIHPVSVHVIALDPVARGAVVRLLVTASSAVPLDNAEAVLVSVNGGSNLGTSRVPLGTLAAGRAAQAVFSVAVPTTGGRTYVQFQVRGQGPQGRLSRGGCYNLLPDGPAEVGRTVVTPQGARVMQFAARRIAR